jgi:hypothetical protein
LEEVTTKSTEALKMVETMEQNQQNQREKAQNLLNFFNKVDDDWKEKEKKRNRDDKKRLAQLAEKNKQRELDRTKYINEDCTSETNC